MKLLVTALWVHLCVNQIGGESSCCLIERLLVCTLCLLQAFLSPFPLRLRL